MSNSTDEMEVLLSEALRNPAARGSLLQHCAAYLRLVAATHADRRIQQRVGVSDIVQESLLEAHRDFAQFHGESSAEFLAWLRQILIHTLARLVECHVRASKRDVRRERTNLERDDPTYASFQQLAQILSDQGTSPSLQAIRHEELQALADALAELSQDHYDVIVFRHLEGLPFREVSQRMGRTEGAVRVLWFRAMKDLRKTLAEKGVL